MTTIPQSDISHSLQVIIICNRLLTKAFSSQVKENLIFTILNDTIHVISYERAVLWDLSQKEPKLLGISGQPEANQDLEIVKKWEEIVKNIKDPSKPQELFEKDFPNSSGLLSEVRSNPDSKLIWLPIYTQEKPVLGLWIERWGIRKKNENLSENIDLFMNFLMPGYGAAWNRFHSQRNIGKYLINKKYIIAAIATTLFLISVIRVPIRIVAPCEVVPDDPYLITAPLEGIIEEVVVKPGKKVEEGDVLFTYDKRVFLEELKISRKDVDITEAEIQRVTTLGIDGKQQSDQPDPLADLSILNLKLEKARVKLDSAEHNAKYLIFKSPASGVAFVNDPDSFRGRPVKVGEKIMTIGKVDQSKIRIWIPLEDNIVLDKQRPIKVFLNVNPEKSYLADLTFVSNESAVNDQNLASFMAEAKWQEKPKEMNLGVKGTAVLYGQKVSLLYYLFRKPYYFIRNLLGL